MRTTNTLVKDHDLLSYEKSELKERIQSINSAMDYIIKVSGDYCAALEFLREHKIGVRLDDDRVQSNGMGLLAELIEVREGLESRLFDLEATHA